MFDVDFCYASFDSRSTIHIDGTSMSLFCAIR